MDWLANNAIYLEIAFIAAAVGCVWGWVKTTQKAWLIGAPILLLLAGGVFLLDRNYESPEQQVRTLLFDTAAAIERDDQQATLNAFIPEAEKERAVIRSQFAAFEISDISIKNNLEIEVSESGRRATAEFNVTAFAKLRRGGQGRRGAFFFIVHFERGSDGWLIESFEYMSAEKGFQRPDAR